MIKHNRVLAAHEMQMDRLNAEGDTSSLHQGREGNGACGGSSGSTGEKKEGRADS